MAQAPPRRPPELMEEIVEEFLLRLPPSDPACLVQAALVSKRWCRLVSGRGFRRRFRELHRAAPMLGFVCNVSWNIEDDDSVENARFVPTSPCLPRVDRRGWRALDARHGRVLFQCYPERGDFAAWGGDSLDPFVVWDPVMGEQLELPPLPPERCYPWPVSFNAALLYANGGGAACEHHDCRCQQFLVVFVGIYDDGMPAYVYSSEAGAWSEPTIAQHPRDFVDLVPAAVVGDAVYFVFRLSTRILKFDLGTRKMSLINLPSTAYGRIIPITTDDGRLGFTRTDYDDFKLHIWSMEVVGPQDAVVWKQDRLIELQDLLPANALLSKPGVAGYINGHDIVFVSTEDGYYTVDPKLNKAVKVGEGVACMKDGDADIEYGHDFYTVVPYTSYFFPALQVASVAVGPNSGGSSA